MKNTVNLITGLVTCLVVLGFYAYLIVANFQLVQAQQPATPTPAPLSLDSATLEQVKARNINGPLPVQIQNGDLDNGQLFQATTQ